MAERGCGSGIWQLPNKLVLEQPNDYLYHLGFSKNDNLQELFGDTKFVCMGGSVNRMRAFAELMQDHLKMDETLVDLCEERNKDRFCMYKVGPVLSLSHGMGMGSLSILLHEIVKLLYYANCMDVVMIRIGSSGGVGVDPGTVVVTEGAFNEMFKPVYTILSDKVNVKKTQKAGDRNRPSHCFQLLRGPCPSTFKLERGCGSAQWQLPNKLVLEQPNDYLYHLGFSKDDNLQELFGDTKFVCMGGSVNRMRAFAELMQDHLKMDEKLVDLCEERNKDRFCMYKVGPVLSLSHGMGMGSLSILLHEIVKLLYYANCMDVVMIRIGSSGGVGVDPGTVVVTEGAFNEMFEPVYTFAVLGKMVKRNTELSEDLMNALLGCKHESDNFKVVKGNTIGTFGFYECQGRLDGAVCEYSEKDKMDYLRRAYKKGVRNFEMEAPCFGAMCKKTGIQANVVCVTFLDRLKGDQVTATNLKEMETYPQKIVARYIMKQINKM
ncbi:uridine phosphorylase 2-like [Anneissia japonica]|uniref:uridine phosphorylase 2-like n=1 Tax=Anneissia japonica TaxID=1529436 RepID=UPI001425BAC5|nr:uridine phosphorylase 2-like [Anneissia japonica]